MAGATTFHELAILNTARAVALAAWTPYMAMFTAAPTDAGGGTEATGGNYARQAITFGAPSGTPSLMVNSGVVSFGTVTWSGTIVAWGIFDALTVGNLRYWFDCPDQVVASGNIVEFANGIFSVSVN